MKKQWLCSLLLLISHVLWAGNLTNINAREKGDHLILQFESQGTMLPNVFVLKEPNRLVVDLKHASEPKLNLSKLEKGVIQSVRPGRPKKDIYRLVFDLSNPVKFKKEDFSTGSKGQNGFRLELIPQTQTLA